MKPFTARAHVLHEANLQQLRELKPNVAILPWGAEEAHNYHLPHGTDVIEVEAIAAEAAERANAQGARCVVLPCVPYGNDNLQLRGAVATITMRTGTQQLVLRDIAYSLVRQGIDRLMIFNFHGGNDFRAMIRDIMLDLPIFIATINVYNAAPEALKVLEIRGNHADELETSLVLHIKPQWVAPLSQAADGHATESKIPALSNLPDAFYPRDWAALTESTGVGDPRKATAEKGKALFEGMVNAVVPAIVQLSKAKQGDFPYIIRNNSVGGRQ